VKEAKTELEEEKKV